MIETTSGLAKLLKLARHEAHAHRVDLAEIDRAASATKGSLEEVDVAIGEEAANASSPTDALRFQDAMRSRRLHLRGNLLALQKSGEETRQRLQTAMVEINKLEHLISLHDAAAQKRDAKKQQNTLDEFAARAARI